MATKAIIVGAGRGIRMMPETESYPKCMIDGLGGRRILDWILDSLISVRVDHIAFVGGYHIEKVIAAYPQLRYYHNDKWDSNNILESLFYAEPEMDSEFVVSYSDIICRRSVLKRLMDSKADVALVVDRSWRQRYVGRAAHPITQAEKVAVLDGKVVEAGKHLSLEKTYGEFIGLAKFSELGAHQMRRHYLDVRNSYLERPFHQAPNIREAYLTDMFEELVDLGVRVETVDIWGEWVELDTPQDLERARSDKVLA